MLEFLNIIDLVMKARELSGPYENIVISHNYDHVVRISRMTEPYFWHIHFERADIEILRTDAPRS